LKSGYRQKSKTEVKMDRKIDLKARSDKLLIQFAREMSCVSVNICQTLLTWQRLVRSEEELKKARAEFASGNSDLVTKEKIDQLSADCQRTACELKKFYGAIHHDLELGVTPSELLAVLGERLYRDYPNI